MSKPVILFVACLTLASSWQEGTLPSDQMVDIGSHRLQARVMGEGSPPVIIDTGLGDELEKWRPLQERIAEVTQVVTYNRAGYGQSQPGPLPRHSGREADELVALLEELSVAGPYVLVGHSLGALNLEILYSRHPDDVAGMVLLDPPPLTFILGQEYKDLGALAEKMTAEWQAIADSAPGSADTQESKRAGFFRMIASEHRELFGETARLVGAISSFGDIPLTVLAAGKPNPAFGELAGEFQTYWIAQSRALAKKSENGSFALARESSHHIYLDAPELVLEKTLSLVSAGRVK